MPPTGDPRAIQLMAASPSSVVPNCNIRRLSAVRTALDQIFPASTPKRLRRHLRTLAALVSAVAASSVAHLPRLAAKAPDRTHPESRVRRFTRLLKNGFVSYGRFFEPVARHLACELSRNQPLLVFFDASALGRSSALYQKRALPLCWLTRQGSKGAFSTADHLALLKRLAVLVPERASAVVLGDGEFDAVARQRAIDHRGWHYVLRTSGRTLVVDGFTCSQARELIATERLLTVVGASVTRERYGPVQALAWHERGHRHGLYLVTNLGVGEEAAFWYRRRFQVETLFSDQKRRGFGLERSHLSDPERLARLMMAVALAYVWLVFLGARALAEGWHARFLRSDRVDLSLFQVGRRALLYLQGRGQPLPVAFSPPCVPSFESVR